MQYQALRTTAEKTEYRRNHACKRRAACHYKSPKGIENAVLWRNQHSDGEECDMCPLCLVFPCLMILNQLSSSLALLQFDRKDTSLDHKERGKREAFARIAFPEAVLKKLPGGAERSDNSIHSTEDFFMLSGKLKRLHSLLKRIDREGGRVLLFSGSTQTLDLIEKFMNFESYRFLRIDGSTPSKKRQGERLSFST